MLYGTKAYIQRRTNRVAVKRRRESRTELKGQEEDAKTIRVWERSRMVASWERVLDLQIRLIPKAIIDSSHDLRI